MRSLIFLMLTGLAITATAQLPSGNYNVIFIAVDDLKPKLGAYGDPDIQTPNLDSLANSAVTFTNMHCQQSVCGPSRISIMTGLRPDTTNVWGNDEASAFRTSITNGASLKTLPQHFGDNGYNAAGFAKLFHGNNATSNDETLSWNSGYTRAAAPYLWATTKTPSSRLPFPLPPSPVTTVAPATPSASLTPTASPTISASPTTSPKSG